MEEEGQVEETGPKGEEGGSSAPDSEISTGGETPASTDRRTESCIQRPDSFYIRACVPCRDKKPGGAV